MTLIEKVALLRDAIVNHKQVTAIAVNHPREFCPHLLGRNSEGGWSILVWQFAGLSEKAFHLKGLGGASILPISSTLLRRSAHGTEVFILGAANSTALNR